jgi:hypothetical protein
MPRSVGAPPPSPPVPQERQTRPATTDADQPPARRQRLQAAAEDSRGPPSLASAPGEQQRATIASNKGRFAYTQQTGRRNDNLNGQVQARDEHNQPYTVRCRHLSTGYFQAPGKKGDFLASVAAADGIARHFEGKSQDSLGDVVENLSGEHRVLVTPSGVGLFFEALARQVDRNPDAPKVADVLLCTTRHVLAAQVERKERKPDEPEPGAAYLALKVYEPNVTGNHVRMEVAQPEELRSVRLGSRPMVAICKDVGLGPERGEFAARMQPEFLKMALQMAMPEALQALADRIHELSDSDLQGCLSTVVGGKPVLIAAMLGQQPWECAGVLQVFEAALRRLGHGTEAVCQAFESHHAGVPALNAAMHQGHGDKVREFGRALVRMDLPPGALVRLLRAENGMGVTGLQQAGARGHADTVQAFAQVLHMLGDALPAQDKLDLFDAVDEIGFSAADLALMNDHGSAHEALLSHREEFAAAAAPPPES